MEPSCNLLFFAGQCNFFYFICVNQMFLLIDESVAAHLFMSQRRKKTDSWRDMNARGASDSGARRYFVNPRRSFCGAGCRPTISKRRPRVKRLIFKSHSLTAEKSAATLLRNTPRISTTAGITCTAAADPISSECRLPLPALLTDRYSVVTSVFFPRAALYYSLSSPREPPPHPESHAHTPRGPGETADQRY